MDTSVSKSKQLDAAIPPSRIASLSSGEFVGMVADNPDHKIDLKVFHSFIQNDPAQLRLEESTYKRIPVLRNVSEQEIQDSYLQIKLDIGLIIDDEMKRLSEMMKKNKNK